MKTRRVIIWTISVVAILLGATSIAQAEDTYWIGTTGDWFHPANWQYTVPDSADDAFVDNGGTVEITGGSAQARSLTVTYYHGNSGNIEHTGGTLTMPAYLYVGYRGTGTYTLSGTAQLKLTSAFQPDYVGYRGTGLFNQSGGTHTAPETVIGGDTGGTGTYNLSGGTHSVTDITLGRHTLSTGTYNLTGTGQLSWSGTHTIGWDGTGTFNQNSGTNTGGEMLRLGYGVGSNGRYTISGGALRAQELQIGYQGTSRFDIDNSAASVTVSDQLFFGADSTFTAVAGSTIHMGGSLDNWNIDETDLTGLNNLSLVFEGGATAGVGTFEVAGEDLGALMSGFDGNFALDALILGGDDTGHIQLVDWRDNMTGTEALYVKDLMLGNGSYLDLNNINLYYLNATIDPGATINLNGGQIIEVTGGGEAVTLTIQVDPNDYEINTITPGIGSYEYLTGRHVPIASLDFVECPMVYRFDHWDGDVADANSANTTVFMDSDKIVTAVFVDDRQCGDECHPDDMFGDYNHDCIIDFNDFAHFTNNWLVCTKPECD